ncbi:MAG: pyridoxal phosphate-dependent aminotransferase [Candidatus Zixiibacteriota bacterium]
MLIDYLTWYKDIEVRLLCKPGIHFLMSSSVDEPTEMLRRDIDRFCRNDISDHLRMSNAWGHVPLIESIAARYEIAADRIVTTNGVSNAIYILCRALLLAGDHVVIESPAYEPLIAAPDFIGCEIDSIRRRPPEFRIDADDLESVLKPNSKLLILSNLHNPSGSLMSDDDLRDIASLAQSVSPKITIVVDEIYHDLGPRECKHAVSLNDCFVSLDGLTKVYGLGSIHTGWIVAQSEVASKVRNLQVIVEGSGSKVNDGIASVVVDNLDEYRDRSIGHVAKNRELLTTHLGPLIDEGLLSGAIPEFGCIYFPRIRSLNNTDSFVDELASRHNIYVVPGKFFGEPSHIRIGFGGESERLDAGVAKLAEAMGRLLT